ncbi:hypothetical protein IMZ48_22195 [Candidatus Bathyarchaeota archaeon]|nr:hypothetical protein [Candidatus Bathyarchaeota archaeon]
MADVPHGADLERLGLHPSTGLDGWVPAVKTRSVAACRSTAKFQQVGEEITELCTLVRDRDPSLVKLSASNNGLFREGVELPGEPRISLRAPSVSLARLLSSASMRNDGQRRLLLSYLLAKAVWKFYDVDWMTEYWTKDAVHFMRLHLDGLAAQQPMARLSHQPFILADLRSSTPRAGMPPQTAAERNRDRTHILPKILALGIMLLEIELGRPVPGSEESPDMNDKQRANAAHIAALSFLDSPEWKARRKRVSLPLAEAIEICVKPDTSRLDPNRTRDSLYTAVVWPLNNLFSTMWLSGSQRPEAFTLDPFDFDEAGAPSHSEFPGSQGAEYPPVPADLPLPSSPELSQIATKQPQPSYSPESNAGDDSNQPSHQSTRAEENEDEGDCPLFGAEVGHDVPAAL